jgi:hypothetical protein
MPDREVYVRDDGHTLPRLLAWLGDVCPDARLHDAFGPTLLYETRVHTTPTSICVTVGVGDGPWISLRFGAPADVFPWTTDAELARAVHRALGLEVRCDPGDLSPAPPQADVWLSVTAHREALVAWEDAREG